MQDKTKNLVRLLPGVGEVTAPDKIFRDLLGQCEAVIVYAETSEGAYVAHTFGSGVEALGKLACAQQFLVAEEFG